MNKGIKQSNKQTVIIINPLPQYKIIKTAIWLYIALIFFEGALRKWVLPGLATPLLLIRDPVALWLVMTIWKHNQFPRTLYLTGIITIGIIGTITAIIFGHGNLAVALYGARILIIHFPIIFIIGRMFDIDDVIKFGKAFLLLSIPMTLLIGFQFYSPQSAWVNRGIGGDLAGSGFSGALGYFRPSGTFSFTNGATLFYGFLSPFVFYFWLNPKLVNRILLYTSTVCLFVAIPFSISRGLFFQIGVSLIFTFSIIIRKPKYAGKMFAASIIIFIALVCLNESSFFQTALKAFTSRFDDASDVEGGLPGTLGDRYLGGLIGAIQESSHQDFFGFGLGMGTNVGSMLLQGKQSFLISEGEWGRLIGELGPLLGLLIIFIRLGISTKITYASYKSLISGNLLPWLLLSCVLTNLPQGQWSQATSLGFSIIITGLTLASLKHRGMPSHRFQ